MYAPHPKKRSREQERHVTFAEDTKGEAEECKVKVEVPAEETKVKAEPGLTACARCASVLATPYINISKSPPLCRRRRHKKKGRCGSKAARRTEAGRRDKLRQMFREGAPSERRAMLEWHMLPLPSRSRACDCCGLRYLNADTSVTECEYGSGRTGHVFCRNCARYCDVCGEFGCTCCCALDGSALVGSTVCAGCLSST